jgi:hypothetical protein
MTTNWRKRNELNKLAWRAARLRGMKCPDDGKFVQDVESGKTKLDPTVVAAEAEAYIATLHCHESCKDYVRENGDAPYRYTTGPRLDSKLCEVCARPMACAKGHGEHQYKEMTQAECRASGLFHAGNCYHVSLCVHCGHVEAVDSSD